MEEGRGIGRDSSTAAMGNGGSQVFTELSQDVEDVERGAAGGIERDGNGRALGVWFYPRDISGKKKKDSPRVMHGSWFYKCGG